MLISENIYKYSTIIIIIIILWYKYSQDRETMKYRICNTLFIVRMAIRVILKHKQTKYNKLRYSSSISNKVIER